jgi:proteasome accessory factor A
LKAGTTALVLEALARDPYRSWPQLAEPLSALTAISRDPQFRWEVTLADGKASSALAVQRAYLAAVRAVCDLSAPDRAAVAADWEAVLNDLEADVLRCRNRLDWVAKWRLIREFQAAQNIAPDDPWLQSLDLEYHRLDLAEGLYYGLEQGGGIVGIPDEAAVRRAVREPPATTRALVRGKCVQKFPAAVASAQWDHITLQGGGELIKISLMDLFAPEEISRYGRVIEGASAPEDLRTLKSMS